MNHSSQHATDIKSALRKPTATATPSFAADKAGHRKPYIMKKHTLNCLWWTIAVSVLMTLAPPVIAEDKRSCDCIDVKLEPSKERIKITRTKEVNQLLQAVERNNPTEIGLLKKIVTTADTFLQRHMNGDIDQIQAPEDWRDYNGPLMAMNMDEWVKMASERSDKDSSHWIVCPRAQTEALISSPNKTVIRYEFVTVGRSMPERLRSYNYIFSNAENGKPFSIEVTVNDQAKVTNMRQIPQGRYSSPYTTVVRTLRQRIKKKPAKDFGETGQKMTANNAQYASEIDTLEQAAKVCATPTKTRK